MMERNLPGLVAANDMAAIDAVLHELLGSQFNVKELIAQ
jgi:precorrin-2 dehydrogenase/sirohydrochlorin ferrochelatase